MLTLSFSRRKLLADNFHCVHIRSLILCFRGVEHSIHLNKRQKPLLKPDTARTRY